MDQYSQDGQEHWVLECLQNKENGTFVDVGCATPFFISNTALLEQKHGWRGIGIDTEPFSGTYYDHFREIGQYPEEILENPELQTWDTRKNTKVYAEDAINFDYEKAFSDNNLPPIIDYLSIDLEPPTATFYAFRNIPHDKYKFRVITYEHDSYRMPMADWDGTADEWLEFTRNYICSLGYQHIKKAGQDDYYALVED